VKYFKSIEHVHQSLIGPHNLGLQGNLLRSMKDTDEDTTKRRKLFIGAVLNDVREFSGSSDEVTTKKYKATKNGDAGWKRKLD
jgi:glucosamine-6-phosphate deaminase